MNFPSVQKFYYIINYNYIMTIEFSNDLKNLISKNFPSSFSNKILDNNFTDLQKLEKNINSINVEEDVCIFNKASTNGLWYNWATDVGSKYTSISYSAGTTWLLNQTLPITLPEIHIFKNKDIKCSNKECNSIYKIVLNGVQGIRSLLVVDNDKNKCDPYCLIGTFEYPNPSKTYNTRLLKWNFKTNKLKEILKITYDNSIRQIIRYKNKFNDIIFYSTQNDTFDNASSKLYWINKSDIDNKKCNKNIKIKYISFKYKNEEINGSIWDFFIDSNTIYVSIPLATKDDSKLTGFNIRARLYYFDINSLFDYYWFETKLKNCIDVSSLIGNCLYPSGFDINSISTVQVITNPKSKEVYIYTLSDFVYQFLFLFNNPIALNKAIEKLDISISSTDSLLDVILAIRKIFLSFDIEGTRIFKFNKCELYHKKNIIFTTVVGNPPYNTLNKSNTTDGYNSYTNLYTWCATSQKNDYYFGTLDIRSSLYVSLVTIIVNLLGNPQGLYQYLITLPEEQIIIITELLNPNFCISSLTDLKNKELYFDIIHIKYDNISKITSDGFNSLDRVNNFSDDGVRNLNIIESCDNKSKYLLVGTTCYQPTNVAKNYLVKIC